MSSRRACTVCKDDLPLIPEFFHRNKTEPSGFSRSCKRCACAAQAKWKANHPDYLKESKDARRATQQAWRAENSDQESASRRKLYRALRREVLGAYGGPVPACNCCGETTEEFLSFDHVEGGGAKHREETGRGFAFLRWLRKNGYPPVVQILCHNCNLAKGFYGYCPHKAAFIPSPES
jgi:hypothetical protein